MWVADDGNHIKTITTKNKRKLPTSTTTSATAVATTFMRKLIAPPDCSDSSLDADGACYLGASWPDVVTGMSCMDVAVLSRHR